MIAFPLCFLSFLALLAGVARPDPLAFDCPHTNTYAPNSTFHSNLISLLSSLSSNSTLHGGFFNSTDGKDNPGAVYGLFLCRGDVTPDACRSCVTTGGSMISRLCGNKTSAVVWYDDCLLRYSDRNIFSVVDSSLRWEMYNTERVTKPKRFREVLGELMNGVAARAARGSEGKKFATGEAGFRPLQRLYALAECTPDLSSGGCELCLRDGLAGLGSCCDGRRGARVLFPSCAVRYEMYPFYLIAAPDQGKGGMSVRAIIGITVAVLTILLTISIMVIFYLRTCRVKEGCSGSNGEGNNLLRFHGGRQDGPYYFELIPKRNQIA